MARWQYLRASVAGTTNGPRTSPGIADRTNPRHAHLQLHSASGPLDGDGSKDIHILRLRRERESATLAARNLPSKHD